MHFLLVPLLLLILLCLSPTLRAILRFVLVFGGLYVGAAWIWYYRMGGEALPWPTH